MPCATIHLALAEKTLVHWSTVPELAPFDPGQSELRQAFLHGALAPDMGYVPGGDHFISDLVHYLRPAALARALLTRSEDPLDEAFAWGWVTHLISDQELHPIVGRAVGERLHGDPDRRVDAGVDVATHVSVEVGIDIVYLLGRSDGIRPPSRPHFDAARIRQLEGALSDTYCARWEAPALLAAHRRAVGLGQWWPRALSILARGSPWGGRAPESAASGPDAGGPPLVEGSAVVRAAASAATALLKAFTSVGSAARGFFAPARPPLWVIREFDRVMSGFPERFAAIVRAGPEAIPDRNLETGEQAGEGYGHPASDRTAHLLRARASAAAQNAPA